jgi:hypothetical protein
MKGIRQMAADFKIKPTVNTSPRVPPLEGRNFIPTTPNGMDRKAITLARAGRIKKAFGK